MSSQVEIRSRGWSPENSRRVGMDPLIPSLGKIINKFIITAQSQSALQREFLGLQSMLWIRLKVDKCGSIKWR